MAFGNLLNPKNDIAFKKIFGSEKNKDILIDFLNDMLVFKANKPITDVTFLKTVQDPEIAAKKTSIVDILCRDEDGNTYVVDMQVAKTRGFEKRAQYYAAKAYIAQMNRGESDYHNLKEVIFLAIVDYVMFPDKQSYKSDHVVLDKDTYQHDLKDFSFTFLDLGKFHKTKEQLVTMIDKWAYYFKHTEEISPEDIERVFAKDIAIQKAYKQLNEFYWDEDELRAYEQELKRERDNKAVLDYKLYQAETEGMTKGITEGMIKGITEGKMDVARNLLKEGLSLSMIERVTGIPAEDLERLKSEFKP